MDGVESKYKPTNTTLGMLPALIGCYRQVSPSNEDQYKLLFGRLLCVHEWLAGSGAWTKQDRQILFHPVFDLCCKLLIKVTEHQQASDISTWMLLVLVNTVMTWQPPLDAIQTQSDVLSQWVQAPEISSLPHVWAVLQIQHQLGQHLPDGTGMLEIWIEAEKRKSDGVHLIINAVDGTTFRIGITAFVDCIVVVTFDDTPATTVYVNKKEDVYIEWYGFSRSLVLRNVGLVLRIDSAQWDRCYSWLAENLRFEARKMRK